jgi:hypothetical protein
MSSFHIFVAAVVVGLILVSICWAILFRYEMCKIEPSEKKFNLTKPKRRKHKWAKLSFTQNKQKKIRDKSVIRDRKVRRAYKTKET